MNSTKPTARFGFSFPALTAPDPELSCKTTYGTLAAKLNTTPCEIYQAIAKLRALDFVKVSPDDGHLSYIFRPMMPSSLTRILEKEIDFQFDSAIESDSFKQATQQIFQFTLNMPLKDLLALKKALICEKMGNR